MDAITAEEIEMAILHRGRMRTGRSLGRTLYLEINADVERCIGIVDNEYLAEKIAILWNEKLGR